VTRATTGATEDDRGEHQGDAVRATVDAPLADARTVFLDLDGCVWFGNELADGAADLVAALRRSGRRVAFLTNTSNSRAVTVAAKLERLGIPATPEEVLMPIEILAEHPQLRSRPPVWVVGQPAVREAVAAITEIAAEPERARVLVLSRDSDLSYWGLADALQVLVRGGALLALNLDARVPVEGGRMLPGTGALAAALSYASGVQAEVVGKPSRFFFETALRRFGTTAEKAVIVGDTLDSDVAGGAGVGMRTVLVGASPASTLDPAPVPDHAVADLREARGLFGV
jgi:HAD superfamily hydrolase (TIGR01450 family)